MRYAYEAASMKFKILLPFTLCMFLGITGCEQLNKGTAEKSSKEIEKRFSMLERKIASINGELSLINASLKEHGKFNRIVYDRLLGGTEFQKNSTGYSILKTNLGYFPIVLKEIIKNPDGSNLTLLLGNPYSFVIHDFDMTVIWSFNASKQPQEKTYTIVKDLLPSAWTAISINVPAEKNEAQDVVLFFKPRTINFDGDYRKVAQNIEMLKLLQSIK